MQRVRIGLTGLAFVFVLVLLGAVFRSASHEEPITANSIELQRNEGGAENLQETGPAEPLAELGVAPGSPETNAAGANTEPPAANPAAP